MVRAVGKMLIFVSFLLVAIVGAWGSGAASVGAKPKEAPSPPTERTQDAAVGASIAHPKNLVVDHERYTYDETYGYTLWRPAGPDAEGSADGGAPVVRVARAYGLKPDGIEARVQERIAAHPDVILKREEVAVGESGTRGVAVGPIPGSTPSVEVYAESKGHVYQINLYGEDLGAEEKELLSSLRFEGPSRSVGSLGLKDGKKAESFYGKGNSEPSTEEREARRRAAKEALSEGPATSGPKTVFASMSYASSTSLEASVPVYGESQIAEGCWRAASTFYFQTQHGWGANPSSSDGIPTGYTLIGRPNYWGQYTHGDYGYGRCASTYYTNDYYAIDFPLNRGDYVFSPFSKGTVVFAGRNTSHANYGIFVVIKDANGKYVSMTGHLDSLAYGIKPGAVVASDTVIGYAGNTGDPSIPVGEVHAHQAFYRYPSFNPDGSPYGGRGLQAVYHHFLGRAGVRPGGIYRYGVVTPNYSAACREGITCGEGYRISN